MLGFYKMSLQGSSHIESNIECQDSSDVKELKNGWIIAGIADGLGSAKHSAIGSKTAIDSVISFIDLHIPKDLSNFEEKNLIPYLKVAFLEAQKQIEQKAKQDGNPISEYDTTLSVAIYNGVSVVFAHCGDGGIISLSEFGEYCLLTQAQKGENEAFNVVKPLRSGIDSWQFGNANSICALILMTDGIYDKACPPILQLDKDSSPIHIDYIRNFIDRNILKLDDENDFVQLESQIKDKFTNDKDITDDKTIVGIINTNTKPDIKDYKKPDFAALKKIQSDGLYPKPTGIEEPTKEPKIINPPVTNQENSPENSTATAVTDDKNSEVKKTQSEPTKEAKIINPPAINPLDSSEEKPAKDNKTPEIGNPQSEPTKEPEITNPPAKNQGSNSENKISISSILKTHIKEICVVLLIIILLFVCVIQIIQPAKSQSTATEKKQKQGQSK
jgi:serine/threonine protein phosphatase PrpC